MGSFHQWKIEKRTGLGNLGNRGDLVTGSLRGSSADRLRNLELLAKFLPNTQPYAFSATYYFFPPRCQPWRLSIFLFLIGSPSHGLSAVGYPATTLMGRPFGRSGRASLVSAQSLHCPRPSQTSAYTAALNSAVPNISRSGSRGPCFGAIPSL
jgi:hypothetical protein